MALNYVVTVWYCFSGLDEKIFTDCLRFLEVSLEKPMFLKAFEKIYLENSGSSIYYYLNTGLNHLKTDSVLIPFFIPLTFLDQFSMKHHAIKSGKSIVYIEGSLVIISQKYCISFSEDRFLS